MGVYTCTVSCRMTEEDRQLLDQRAESLELANSEAIRALLRLPIADPDDLVAIDAGSRVVVIDAKTMGRINRELIRWGRHYNQAVRALNTIAMFARNKGGIDPQVAKEQLTKAASELELVQGSVEESRTWSRRSMSPRGFGGSRGGPQGDQRPHGVRPHQGLP